MRKITEKIVTAFLDGDSLAIDNTMTDGADIRLHGNVIAYWDIDATVIITLAGWNTPTTKERTNGLVNAGFHTVKGQAMRNHEPVDDNSWIKIS